MITYTKVGNLLKFISRQASPAIEKELNRIGEENIHTYFGDEQYTRLIHYVAANKGVEAMKMLAKYPSSPEFIKQEIKNKGRYEDNEVTIQ